MCLEGFSCSASVFTLVGVGSACAGLLGRCCVGSEDGCASRISVGGSPTPAADGGFLKGQNLGELGHCDSWPYWYMLPTHLHCLWLLLGVFLGCSETVGLDLRFSSLPLGQGPTVAFTNKWYCARMSLSIKERLVISQCLLFFNSIASAYPRIPLHLWEAHFPPDCQVSLKKG